MFLKNRNNISKIKRSKVTDYAALIFLWGIYSVTPRWVCSTPSSLHKTNVSVTMGSLGSILRLFILDLIYQIDQNTDFPIK